MSARRSSSRIATPSSTRAVLDGVNDEEPALSFADFEVATPTRSQEEEDEAALAAAEAKTLPSGSWCQRPPV